MIETDFIHAAVQESPLSLDAASAFACKSQNGAEVLFVGRIRNNNQGKDVQSMEYDAFIPMAEKVLAEICEEAGVRFGADLVCFVEHFKGRLEIGGIAVLIAVGAPHRVAAFDGCRYIIEELKVRAPVWKHETYSDGAAVWLDGAPL